MSGWNKLALPKTVPSESGFTLLELLVTMAVLSLLLTLAFGAFRTAGEVSARVDKRLEATDEIVAAQDFLRELIAHAYPAVISLQPVGYRVSMQGSADVLEFTSTLPHEAAFGEQRVAIYRSEHDGHSLLVLVWRPERNDAISIRETSSLTEIPILTAVRSIGFRYFGQAQGEHSSTWHTTWLDQTSMPRLVRIEVTLEEAGRHWPVLDAAPRTNVDATCVLDLLSYGCRGR
jgi:general secretion pathway protein J